MTAAAPIHLWWVGAAAVVMVSVGGRPPPVAGASAWGQRAVVVSQPPVFGLFECTRPSKPFSLVNVPKEPG